MQKRLNVEGAEWFDPFMLDALSKDIVSRGVLSAEDDDDLGENQADLPEQLYFHFGQCLQHDQRRIEGGFLCLC